MKHNIFIFGRIFPTITKNNDLTILASYCDITRTLDNEYSVWSNLVNVNI